MNDIFKDNLEEMTVDELDKEVGWPLEYTSTIYLWPYISRLREENLVGVEIGTGRGEGAHYLLEKCSNIKKLYTIDPYKEYFDWIGLIAQESLSRDEEIAKKNFAKFGDKVSMIKKKSVDAAKDFDDESLNFIIIDGDHQKQEVINDLLSFYPKVKKNGIIAVHDCIITEVKNAVREFREAQKIRVPLNNVKNGIAFWYKS